MSLNSFTLIRRGEEHHSKFATSLIGVYLHLCQALFDWVKSKLHFSLFEMVARCP